MEAAMETTTQEAAAAAAERPSSALALRSLADYTVGDIPTLFYVPDFISQSEQSQLLHHIYQAPAPKWKSLKNRRLQNWGGVVHEKGLLPQALPSWLTRITNRICQWAGLFPSAINHVLINEYHPNQGIMPHQDGPAYYPVVAIISLASPVVIDFTPHQRFKEQEHTDPQNLQIDELPGPVKMESNGSGSHECGATNESDPASSSLMLMPCSLLIFKDQAYTDYLHGIQDNELHNLDKVVNLSRCPELKHLSPDSMQGSMDEQHGTFRRTATRVSNMSVGAESPQEAIQNLVVQIRLVEVREVLWKLFGEQCVHKRKQKINQPYSDLEFQRAEEKEADKPISVEGVHVLPM